MKFAFGHLFHTNTIQFIASLMMKDFCSTLLLCFRQKREETVDKKTCRGNLRCDNT